MCFLRIDRYLDIVVGKILSLHGADSDQYLGATSNAGRWIFAVTYVGALNKENWQFAELFFEWRDSLRAWIGKWNIARYQFFSS